MERRGEFGNVFFSFPLPLDEKREPSLSLFFSLYSRSHSKVSLSLSLLRSIHYFLLHADSLRQKKGREQSNKKCGQEQTKSKKIPSHYLRPIPPALPFIFFFSPPAALPAGPAPRLVPPLTPSFLTSPEGATGLKNESSLPCCALAPAEPRRPSAPRMRPSSKSFSRTRNWMMPSTSGLVNLIGGSWSSGEMVGSVRFFFVLSFFFWGGGGGGGFLGLFSLSASTRAWKK